MSFDRECRSYLRQWEKRATVRTLPRYRLPPEGEVRELFPARLQPLAAHPAVVARGPHAVRELLIRTAYAFQADIALLETDIVVRLCSDLATRGPGCPIPESARQVALTIATDEAYHAFAAREFIEDVRQHTGIEPPPVGETEPGLAKSLRVAVASAPAGLGREVETLVLCFAEHFVTESLVGLSREAETDSPFHAALREHLIDEGRHQVFFRSLLRHLWAALDEERRRALGRIVPLFLDDFLYDREGIQRLDLALLGQMGFAPAEAQRLADEKYEALLESAGGRKDRLPHARHCLALVRLAGLLDHGPTRDALVESGWVPEMGEETGEDAGEAAGAMPQVL